MMDDFTDFLLNYGWAIIIILVMVGMLAYFGVLESNNTYVIEKPYNITCTYMSQYPCGLSFSGCSDNRTYNCMQNVKYIVINDNR